MASTIAAIAAGNGDFEILTRALEVAGLTGAVADPHADLTVFAPTDAAFGQLAADLGFGGDVTDEDAVFGFLVGALTDLGGGDPIPVLTDILLYHVSPGAQRADKIAEAPQVETLLTGATITALGAELSDKDPDVANPSIVIEDIRADNGLIQAIDRVLLPIDLPGDAPAQNLAEVASSDPNFSILVTALSAAGLVPVVADPDADFTVFAPTNQAFANLAVVLGFDGDQTDPNAVFGFLVDALTGLSPDGDPIPLLTDILLYHVSDGSKTLSDLAAETTVPTALAGAAIAPDGTSLGDADPELPDPQIVVADVPASNGVIQAIDNVLIPLDLPFDPPLPTIAGVAVGNPDFSILVKALVAADLVAAVDTGDDLTVFAPTNDAFTKLAISLGYTGGANNDDAVFDFLVGALTELGGGDPIPPLTDVLLYHVSPGAKTFSEISSADSVATLLGANLTPDGAELGDLDPDAPNPEIVLKDVPASNGVIQAIDAVLLPLDLPNGNAIEGTDTGEALQGTSQADLIFAGAGGDFVTARAGDDIIDAGRGGDSVWASFGDDLVRAGGGKDLVFGGDGDDFIRGDGGHDRLNGGSGDDEILGNGGADSLHGDAGDDILGGGVGDDYVAGGGGDDEVFGGGGKDTVLGGGGDDFVSGGRGKDLINGGHGDDELRGGSHTDTFVFLGAFGDDLIRDFEDDHDVIRLKTSAEDFHDLKISQDGRDAVIEIGDDSITLRKFDADDLTEQDFIFV